MAARAGALRSTIFRAIVGTALAIPLGTSVVSAAPCTIKPRFQALVREIPDILGKCLANETFDFSTGDIRQVTNRGELLMRAADGVAQFTDVTNANQTWVAGPQGVLPRREDERFSWEAPVDQAQGLADTSGDSGADQTVVDTNVNDNANDLSNTSTVTADGGNATGGTANAQGGASNNTNTNTVNPVINVVVNVPPSAPSATAVPTPAAAITSTVLPTVTSTFAPIPAVAPVLPAPTGQWVAWTSPLQIMKCENHNLFAFLPLVTFML